MSFQNTFLPKSHLTEANGKMPGDFNRAGFHSETVCYLLVSALDKLAQIQHVSKTWGKGKQKKH